MCGTRWITHALGILVAVALGTVGLALAQDPPVPAPTPAAGVPATSTAPADPMAEIRKIEQELQELGKTPSVKEISEVEEAMRRARSQLEKQLEPLNEKYTRLQQTEDYRKYRQKLDALNTKRNAEWEAQRLAIAKAARELYAARHEEIRKLAAKDTPEAKKLGFDVLTYPRIDGSTSTHPLCVIMACRFLGVPYEWQYPEPTGYPSSWFGRQPRAEAGLFLPGAGYGGNPEFNLAALRTFAKPAKPEQERTAVMINSLLAVNASTHVAYENLINGKCELNLTARAPSEDEKRLAKEKGVEIALKPIAKDALVFIVNSKNPVKSLTMQQVLDIYAKKTKSWKDLGWTPQGQGATDQIRPLWRERNSGSRELFDALVMKDARLTEPKPPAEGPGGVAPPPHGGAESGTETPAPAREGEPMISYGMSGPYNRITGDANAIGYSVYYYEHFMAASPHTRTIAIDGVEPTADTIASGKYPLVAEVYVAYRANEPADSPAMKMLKWLTSQEGQAVIRESGYVPAGK